MAPDALSLRTAARVPRLSRLCAQNHVVERGHTHADSRGILSSSISLLQMGPVGVTQRQKRLTERTVRVPRARQSRRLRLWSLGV
jgi:hypothetical protein